MKKKTIVFILIRGTFNDFTYNLYPDKTIKKQHKVQAFRINEANPTEIEIVKKINHRNFISYFGEVHITGSFYSYYLAESSEVSLYEHRNNTSSLPESFIVSTLFQLLNAVNFLHCKGYVHRNICAENTLLFNDGRLVKISKFSRAQRSTDKNSQFFSDVVQAPEYLSPRVVSGLPCRGVLQDTWAVGVILVFLIKGKYLWNLAVSKEKICFKVFKAQGNPYESVGDESLKFMLLNLLELEDARMLSVSRIVDDWMCVKTNRK